MKITGRADRTRYADREDAGRDLEAPVRAALGGHGDPVVLGLPRGGVVVAAALARAANWPVDVLVVRKVGAPAQPEYALAAVGEAGVTVHNPEVPTGHRALPTAVAAAHEAVDALVDDLRGGRALDLMDRAVAIVDDGIATGATARAAVAVARARGAAWVLVAAPIASPRAVQALNEEADAVVVRHQPTWFRAVGDGYEDFRQVPTAVVRNLLAQRDAEGHLSS